MNRLEPVGPARSLSYGARQQLAAILRARWDRNRVVGALLHAYGAAVHDFIMLMIGPGNLADQVLADTVIAVTHLVDWLPDDDLLTAWVFAIARQQYRRHPPVVWQERRWQELRDATAAWGGWRTDSVPVPVVRMALLGIAPQDRELLLMSSTYCKLMSSDLAAIFGMTVDEAAAAVANAHRRFEEALAMSAAEVGYQRDPRSRAPEIGELIGIAMRGVNRLVPEDRVYYMALAPEAADYRREVLSGIGLAERDGFPVPRRHGRAVGVGHRPRQMQPGRHPRGRIPVR
jgi:DNA-directed RNA polymerase specialized sigma24 family protein